MTTNPDRLPRKFHRQADDTIVCPHRDLGCCPICIADHSNLRPMMGVTYWMTDAEFDLFITDLAEVEGVSVDQYRAEFAEDRVNVIENADRIRNAR
jgi:hypothetical protein